MSEDLIRPNPPGFVVEPDDLHVARLYTAEERIAVIFPDSGLVPAPAPAAGFAWALDADGLPAMACPLSNTVAAVGAMFIIRHAGTYVLRVAVACSALPTGGIINTSLKAGFSTNGNTETIVGPSTATFIDNITVVKAPYVREHPAQLVLPNPDTLLRVTVRKTDSSNGTGSLAILAMFVVKVG